MTVPPICVIGSNSISGASFIRTRLERGRPVLAMHLTNLNDLRSCFTQWVCRGLGGLQVSKLFAK